MIKAVVFDFDGLIIDTETPEYEVFKQIYSEYGVDLPLEMYAQNIGTVLGDFNPHSYLGEYLKQDIDPEFVKNLHKERYSILMENFELRDGVLDYLNKAKEMNLKIALATSSHRPWIDGFFERFDLHHYFDCISTAEDVEKVKPDPALYLRTLSLLGVDGNEAIAFEDSYNGSKAAVAAGMHCIAVPNPVTNHFSFEHCSAMISSMSETPLSAIIATLESEK